MAIFIGQAATNNVFNGTAVADTFQFAAADLNSLDTLTGGGGADILQLTTAGALAADALAGVACIPSIFLNTGGNGITLLNANYAGVAGSKITITGGAGDDTVDGSSLTGINAVDIRAGAGLDVLKGGAGSDTFRFAAADLSGDTIIGGFGNDFLVLTTAGALAPSALGNMSGVEIIQLTAGTNGLKLTDGNFTGISGKITIFGTSGNETIDASGLTGTNAVDIRAGAGLDVLRGGAGSDFFNFAIADLSTDTITGGLGTDYLVLNSAGTLGSAALANVSGVEVFSLAAGTNNLTLAAANATGLTVGRITVNGNSGDDTVDASGFTRLTGVNLIAGAGSDVLKGSAANDLFNFAAADLSGDTISGGLGNDILILTTAGTLAATALANMTGVESINLAAGTNAATLFNANYTGVASGRIIINGNSGNDTLDASGLTGTNAADLRAGAGTDTLKGGAGADSFQFAAASLDALDTITGNGGADLLRMTTAGALAANALAGLTSVETITLANGTNAITLANSNYAGVTGGKIVVNGGTGNDFIDGSALTGTNAVDIKAGLGVDVLKGGAGSDTFRFSAFELAGDTISGGLGTDFLALSTAGVLGATALSNLTGVEIIQLVAGANGITILDGNFTGVAAGTRITVFGNGGNDLIDAAGLTGTNAVDIRAGAGLDLLKGGAGADYFNFAAADLAGDTIIGGLGSDILILATAGVLGATALANLSGVESINLAAGTNGLTLANANFTGVTGARITVTCGTGNDTVDASALTGTNSVDLRGGAGLDAFKGGAGADAFRFATSAFDAGDTVNGGSGAAVDTLAFTGAGTIDLAGINVAQIEAVTTDNADHTILLANDTVLAAQGSSISITAGTGADTLDVSRVTNVANAVQVNLGDGADTLIASFFDAGSGTPVIGLATGKLTGTLGLGNDTLKTLSGYFNDLGSISGGNGTDTIEINNFYGNATTMGAGLTGFEVVNLVDTITGGGYKVYFVANDTAGLTINGQRATNSYHLNLGAGGQTANGNGLDDSLFGGSGNDTINGNGGDDFIEAFGGSNASNGGAGNDSIVWHAGDVVVAGGANNDTLISVSGGNFDLSQADQSLGDTVNTSGFENVNLYQAYDPNTGYSSSGAFGGTAKGSSGANVINGSQYNDVLDGNGGADSVYGNDGADTITYRGTELEVNAYYAGYSADVGQNDTLVLAAAATVNLGNADQTSGDTVTVGGFQNVDATALAIGVSLTGDFFDNRLIGGSGADMIAGNEGYDWIDGAAGLDSITGGIGNDTITDRGTASTINGGADFDTLRVVGAATINLNNGDQTSGDTAIVSAFESVNGSASSVAFSAIGRSDVRSELIGGSAGDTLTAGSGGGEITGNGGADTLTGGSDNDSFYFNAGDVAAGEAINGNGGAGDTFYVRATTNFSSATVTGVEALVAAAADVSGNLLNQGMTITMTGAQAAGFTQISANYYYSGTVEVFNINVASGTTVDLTPVSFSNFDVTDTLAIAGAAGNETISGPYFSNLLLRGNGGNDTLKTSTGYGYWADGTQVLGDAGNDRIDYGYRLQSTTIDGGADSDTLVFSYNEGVIDQIDLSQAVDQSIGDNAAVKGFENIDWSASYWGIDAIGSSSANIFVGSQGSDTINGGGGNDIIDGWDGSDAMTGGSGSDVFVWLTRYTSGDAVTDFLASEDDLRFASTAFDFNGAAFDQRLATGSTAADITGVDLVIYTGGTLDSISDVQNYLGYATGGSVGEGIFIVGKDSSNRTVLYHALDASFTLTLDVVEIANLGTMTAPTSIQLADFIFV